MAMHRLSWKSVLPWLLAAFFVVGGLGNIFATEAIRADYARWGYPAWFHYVTGLLELTAAGLLMLGRRRLGAGLAVAVMSGAAATVLLHGEITHAIAPLVVLCVSVVVLRIAAADRA